jgi:hypothetical protein
MQQVGLGPALQAVAARTANCSFLFCRPWKRHSGRDRSRCALDVLCCGRVSQRSAVRVADCEPGAECQAVGKMGLLDDLRAAAAWCTP